MKPSAFVLLLMLLLTGETHAQKAIVYAALFDEHNLAIVDPDAGRIIQRIQVGRGPDNVICTKGKSRLYISNTGEITVSIVSIPEKRVAQVLRLPVNRRNIYAGPMTMTPDGSQIFVAERAENNEELRIYVIDTKKENIVAQFDCGKNVNALSVSHDGRKLFVVNKSEGIQVFDVETRERIGMVELLKGAAQDLHFIACSPSEAKACITYGPQNKVQIISTETYKTESVVQVPKFKTGAQKDIFFSPNGAYAFIINHKVDLKEVDGINVLDMTKKEFIKIFNSGVVHRGQATTENGSVYYVAGPDLKWYNLLTLEHLKTVSLRTRIYGIAVIAE